MRRTRTRSGVVGTALALAAAASIGLWPAVPAGVVAAPGGPADPILDVELDVDTVTAGSTVTLTARIFDALGDPLAGPSTNTSVRFYFQAGSANDPGGNGNGADLGCHTGQVGWCSVAYVAVNVGVDVVCATTANGSAACSEAVDAPERTDAADAVQRTVVAADPSPNSDPSPSPSPSPDPSPNSDPSPSPSPSADPSPSLSPDPSPTPSPDPSPAANTDPLPSAEPSPSADPSPSPSPEPSPSATPPADPVPSQEPSPSATPASDPSPSPSVEPTPSATASPSPSVQPSPSASPTPAATSAPTATPGPAASSGPSTAPESVAPSAAPSDAPQVVTPSASPESGRGPLTALVVPAGGGSGNGGTGVSGGTGGDVVRGPSPDRPSDAIRTTVEAIVGFAVDGATRVLQPEAAATVATTFGFPIALAVLVLLFLLVQSRLDDRDPKLRAPMTADTLVGFEDDPR